MPTPFPNRKCTCGFTRFRDRRMSASSIVERWVLFNGLGGVGSIPVGLGVGAGPGQWGLFDSTLRSTQLETVCESCSRVRSTQRLGGIAAFGAYVSGSSFFLVASDAPTPITCFFLKLVGPGGETIETPFSLVPMVLPPAIFLPTPATTAATLPPGALIADQLLVASLSTDVPVTGTYQATLVDRCARTETALIDIVLEAEPMILTPQTADLSGAPRAWLSGPGGNKSSIQIASGSRLSIPFDKCSLVIEYDARKGTLPAAQGFTHAGTGAPGDYQLVEGGALYAVTTPTFPSYWSKTVAMTDNPGRAFVYAQVNANADVHVNPGDGFDFMAKYAVAPAVAYLGVRITHSDGRWYVTRLNSSAEATTGDIDAAGWSEYASGQVQTPLSEQTWRADNNRTWSGTVFGSMGLAGALEGIATFGDTNGVGIDAITRNFVASFGGRFIRAGFTGYAQTDSPIVRLYLASDVNGSVSKTARFRITYGTGTGAPYSSLPSTVDATVNFVVPNSVYEVPFTLPGLTANQPFWMTIERAWDHADDKLVGTVHMFQGTVRAQ